MTQPMFVAINGTFYAISLIEHFGMDEIGTLVIQLNDSKSLRVVGEPAKRLLHALQPLVLMYHTST